MLGIMFKNIKNNGNFWRRLTNFWTIIAFAAIIYNFFGNGKAADFLGPLLAIYVAALAFYAGDKEFERWYYNHDKKHPGEIFVIIWTILVISILSLDFIFSTPYKMPNEVTSAYIAVLGILAITKKSSYIYEHKRRRKK